MTLVGVVTVVHGRHDHLARVADGLVGSLLPPGVSVLWEVVSMGDAVVTDVVADVVLPAWLRVDVRDRPLGDGGRLPLAAARNDGAREALAAGADPLVFLDVDCIPDPALLTAYLDASLTPATRDRLLCGPVAYLPPPPRTGYDLARLAAVAEPHPARPAPPRGTVVRGGSHDLFWSLSFAAARPLWERLGGFHEGYDGYGGEDTDLARKARREGVELAWIGSARAFHQHHAVSDPPVEHLDDILRNARLFHSRWGSWPMGGWLDAFAELGLVVRTGDDVRRVTTG